MRGHWVSQTRKLNKHYQDGGVGQPAPPYVLTLGEFYMGGGSLPQFRHLDNRVPVYPSGDNEFYNTIETNRLYVDNDFSKSRLFYGYRDLSKKMFVGGFYEDPDWTGRTWEQEALDRLQIEESNHRLSEPLDIKKNIYQGYGMRFVSFHYPEYWYSTPYNWERYNSSIAHQVCHFIKSGLEMSPEGYRNNLYPYTGYSRSLGNNEFYCSTDIGGGQIYTQAVEPEEEREEYFNLWTMTQNGESYIPLKSVNIYVNGAQRTVKGRIYCFIFNGVYYVDQLVHTGVWNNGVWEGIASDNPIFLTQFKFPYLGLGGYCKQHMFICPSDTPYFQQYPSRYPGPNIVNDPIYDVDGGAVWTGMGASENFDVSYGSGAVTFKTSFYVDTGATTFSPNANNTRMMMMNEEEYLFWTAEAMWHAQYGGTSYNDEFEGEEYPNGV